MNEVGSIVDDIRRKSKWRDFIFLFIHIISNKVAHELVHHALWIHEMEI